MKKDGHIHTPFCPHGSSDAFEEYINKAIASGFSSITFTEHAPLPKGFIDPTPDQDSGMNLSELHTYIETVQHLKRAYSNQIQIQVGLEVDFIEGYEAQTMTFLNEYGPELDDSILSVHFLKQKNQYTCIDFSKETYLQFCHDIGSANAMYDLYYETVEKSIMANLGEFKPTRIGHPTLIHKFQLALSEKIDDTDRIKRILHSIKAHNLALDYNSAGLSKPLCQESYPADSFLPFIKEINLPYVFGSDAHTALDLHQHYEKIMK